ncbi:baculoviral IAP repeat-containing protein 3-like [Panonychus citri]|uniref:baculoviral IAP repeat-containing protein 3-like n=1 Tax=Panonychus citri TaxID=50023 RepID=UPI00230828C1|nr:baculoviral IAP repeat-containing protein 3-like [Panonychus citri]
MNITDSSNNASTYASEQARYESFFQSAWGTEISYRTELARDGFYFTGISRQVKCFFCGYLYHASIWQDLHWIEHRLHSSDCPFIQGLPCGNIPRSISTVVLQENTPLRVMVNYENEESRIVQNNNPSHSNNTAEDRVIIFNQIEGEDVVDDYPRPQNNDNVTGISNILTENENSNNLPAIERTNRRFPRVSRRITRNRLVSFSESSNRRRYFKPLNLQFRTLQSRTETFSNWPINEIITPKELAEAGFFYTRVYDHTRCFNCNGTISNWERGDNAWAVHAYYFPKCSYLYLKRGQMFVDDINSPTDTVTPLTELPQPTDDKDRYTCKICLDKEIGTVFAPCDHAISCIDCATQLDDCPICKSSISHICRMKLIN